MTLAANLTSVKFAAVTVSRPPTSPTTTIPLLAPSQPFLSHPYTLFAPMQQYDQHCLVPLISGSYKPVSTQPFLSHPYTPTLQHQSARKTVQASKYRAHTENRPTPRLLHKKTDPFCLLPLVFRQPVASLLSLPLHLRKAIKSGSVFL